MPFQPSEMSEATLRRLVDNIARHVKSHPLTAAPKRSQLQEALAATFGWPSYHAAITEIKRKAKVAPAATPAPQSAPSLSTWKLSPPLIKDLHFPSSWTSKPPTPSDADNHAIVASDFACSVLMRASERKRREIVDQVLHLNPSRPVCIIKGPMSTLRNLANSIEVSEKHATELLESGTASQITEMLTEMLRKISGDGDMWQSRAITLMSAVVLALVYERDRAPQENVLTPASLVEHVDLVGVVKLAARHHLPPHISQSLKAYLCSLPGYEPSKEKQSSVSLEQHGYLQMQLTPILERLSLQFVPSLQKTAPKGSDVSKLDIRLPDYDISQSEADVVKRSVQSWMDTNPSGLVVFDVPPVQSDLWPWLVNRLPHWLDRGVAVWVGVADEGDIPSSVFKPLYPRLNYKPQAL